MSTTTQVWVVIALGAIGTYSIRASFLLLADRMAALPQSVRTALRMIPAAALAALVAPGLLRPGDDGLFEPFNPRAIAGLVALVVAWWTKNVLATIVVGLVVIVGLEAILS